MKLERIRSEDFATMALRASFERLVSEERRTAALFATHLLAVAIFAVGAIAQAVDERWSWLSVATEKPIVGIGALLLSAFLFATMARSYWKDHARLIASERALLESELRLARLQREADASAKE